MTDRTFYESTKDWNTKNGLTLFVLQSLCNVHMTDDLFDSLKSICSKRYEEELAVDKLKEKFAIGTSLDVAQDLDSSFITAILNSVSKHLGVLQQVSISPTGATKRNGIKVEFEFELKDGSTYELRRTFKDENSLDNERTEADIERETNEENCEGTRGETA